MYIYIYIYIYIYASGWEKAIRSLSLAGVIIEYCTEYSAILIVAACSKAVKRLDRAAPSSKRARICGWSGTAWDIAERRLNALSCRIPL